MVHIVLLWMVSVLVAMLVEVVVVVFLVLSTMLLMVLLTILMPLMIVKITAEMHIRSSQILASFPIVLSTSRSLLLLHLLILLLALLITSIIVGRWLLNAGLRMLLLCLILRL